ncbi:MAG: hypothetical protein RLO17_08645 [Cyclobacteriaceae bacterium]
MKKTGLPYIIFLFLGIVACQNSDVNEGEQFKPREIHEDIVFHFDTITVDGIEYLILEKDNNNPHEGFGFMAFRANKLMEKQDTVLAYLRTITDLQVEILSHLKDQPVENMAQYATDKFNGYIEAQKSELMLLENKEFRNRLDSTN